MLKVEVVSLHGKEGFGLRPQEASEVPRALRPISEAPARSTSGLLYRYVQMFPDRGSHYVFLSGFANHYSDSFLFI